MEGSQDGSLKLTHFFFLATQFVWPGLCLLKTENHLRFQVA